jgi:hypothetical protein
MKGWFVSFANIDTISSFGQPQNWNHPRKWGSNHISINVKIRQIYDPQHGGSSFSFPLEVFHYSTFIKLYYEYSTHIDVQNLKDIGIW